MKRAPKCGITPHDSVGLGFAATGGSCSNLQECSFVTTPWHSDTEKSLEYQAASPHMKLHDRKCAEIRVLSAAKDIIPPLRQWILDARADGHDL